MTSPATKGMTGVWDRQKSFHVISSFSLPIVHNTAWIVASW